jgi:hypothetical protein
MVITAADSGTNVPWRGSLSIWGSRLSLWYIGTISACQTKTWRGNIKKRTYITQKKQEECSPKDRGTIVHTLIHWSWVMVHGTTHMAQEWLKFVAIVVFACFL